MLSPNGAIFGTRATYIANLAGDIQFAGIPASRLHEIYRDGRVCGFIMADLLEHHFLNLERVGGTEDPTILEDSFTLRRFRVKIMTKHGCDLDLSSMLGTQRSHLPGQYSAHWSGEIDGWLVVDIRKMPEVTIAAVDKIEVKPPAHRLNQSFWDHLARTNNLQVKLQ